MWLIILDIKLAEKTREGWVDGREGGRKKDGRKERGEGERRNKKEVSKLQRHHFTHLSSSMGKKKSYDYLLENIN